MGELKAGDFVWCYFPYDESITQPGPEEHIAYVLATAGDQAMVAYTTTTPWPVDAALPPGVLAFSRDEAIAMGHQHAFTLHVTRLGILPITLTWFSRLNQPDRGIVGAAPDALRVRIEKASRALLERSRDVIRRYGPDAQSVSTKVGRRK